MNGYSKLRLGNYKSRSIDFADLLISNTFPGETLKCHEKNANTSLNHRRKTDDQETNTINHHQCPSEQQQVDAAAAADDEQDQAAASNRKSNGVGVEYLSKNYSVSSATSSHRFRLERQRSTLTRKGIQSAVKRAFSMRRSSSSSVPHEKYCRIHDQCVAVLLDDDVIEATEDNNIPTMDTLRSMEKKKCESSGRILKACKSLLGF